MTVGHCTQRKPHIWQRFFVWLIHFVPKPFLLTGMRMDAFCINPLVPCFKRVMRLLKKTWEKVAVCVIHMKDKAKDSHNRWGFPLIYLLNENFLWGNLLLEIYC